MNGSNLVRTSLILGVLSLNACSSSSSTTTGGAGTAAAAGLVVSGPIQTSLDGASVSLDYKGGTVVSIVNHKLATDAENLTCVTEFDMSLAKKDGSCQLDLQFKRGNAGLALDKARFYITKTVVAAGVGSSAPCVEWPEKAASETFYEGTGDNATLTPNAIGKPLSTQAAAVLTDIKVVMTGTIEMKKAGKKFTIDLSKFTLQGTVNSTGRTDVTCGTVAAAVGIDQCPKKATFGTDVGQYVKRGPVLYRCDDDQPYDFGELCGSSAIWITSHHDYLEEGLKAMSTSHRTTYNFFKGKNLGVVWILVEGKEKTVVEDPPGSGKGKLTGAKPTAEECKTLAEEYKLAPEVVLLYDKDVKLSDPANALHSGSIPWAVFAKGDGKIVAILPGSDNKVPQSGAVQQAITDAMEAQ